MRKRLSLLLALALAARGARGARPAPLLALHEARAAARGGGRSAPQPPLAARAAATCGGHLCSGYAEYPVADDGLGPTRFSARFTVPGLPLAPTPSDPDFCHYIYFNIFFPNYAPPGAVYNQFVPQLMLGNALSGSSGAPGYAPSWGNFSSYVFQAQYFFALLDAATNATVFKAATGPTFPAAPGEDLWTAMDLDTSTPSWAWTLRMGVVGDAARTSTLAVPAPFMGLLAPATASWREAAYSQVHVNSCLELYGLASPGGWPSTGSAFDMRVTAGAPGAIAWATNFSNGSTIPNCSGAPSRHGTTEAHSAAQQNITWAVGWAPPPGQ
jgi:hypothetical protein